MLMMRFHMNQLPAAHQATNHPHQQQAPWITNNHRDVRQQQLHNLYDHNPHAQQMLQPRTLTDFGHALIWAEHCSCYDPKVQE